MRIDKNGIPSELHDEARSILNKLKNGQRVFGVPAEGLKITMRKLEENRPEGSVTDFEGMNSGDNQLRLIKAGINGEVKMASHIEKLSKHLPYLDDVIFFSSLSVDYKNDGAKNGVNPNIGLEEDDEDGIADDQDYILDTDFVAVCGNNVLALDAKNLMTKPEMPLQLLSDGTLSSLNKKLVRLHPSTYIWENYLLENKHPVATDGFTVIVNKTGATIFKNQNWHNHKSRPIHISELHEYLKEWIDEIEDKTVNLAVLTLIGECLISSKTETTGIKEAFANF